MPRKPEPPIVEAVYVVDDERYIQALRILIQHSRENQALVHDYVVQSTPWHPNSPEPHADALSSSH